MPLILVLFVFRGGGGGSMAAHVNHFTPGELLSKPQWESAAHFL